MTEPPRRGPGNLYRPVQWDRRLDRERRLDRRRRRLERIINRRVIAAVAVVGLLAAVGVIMGGEERPPTESAPAPADETEALVAVRAAEARAGYGIIVRVVDGAVTLAGTVATPADQESAEAVARSVVGADFRISNRLTVGGESGPVELEEEPDQLSSVTDADLALQNKLSSLLARDPITFGSASADIDDESLATLDALAADLAASTVEVIIAGHTDSDGSPEANLELSQHRAEAVLAHLADAGILPARLAARGFGGAYPVADNLTREGKAANRRIEVLIKPS